MKMNWPIAAFGAERHELRVVAMRTPERQRALHDRHAERQHQGVMAEFDDHWLAPSAFASGTTALPVALAFVPHAGLLQALGDLGRHVVLVMLGQHLGSDEGAVLDRSYPGRRCPGLRGKDREGCPRSSPVTSFAWSVSAKATMPSSPAAHAAIDHQAADAKILAPCRPCLRRCRSAWRRKRRCRKGRS